MNHRAFCLVSVAVALATVVGAAAVNFSVDPLLQYRPPVGSARYDMNLQRQINPGRARNQSYDTIVVGSSMTENFRQSEIDQFFGGRSLNLAFSGMRAFEARIMMAYALRQRPVNRAFVSLDFATFMPLHDEAARERNFPRHYYDSSLMNDYEYLVNFGTLKRSLYQVCGLKAAVYNSDGDAPWYWGDKKPLSRQVALRNWARKRSRRSMGQWPVADMAEGFKHDILAVVDENPSTRFELFFPPISVLEWQLIAESGNLNQAIEFRGRIVELTAGREAVRIHDFQADDGITADLDHYADTGHFGPGTSSELLKRMASGDWTVDRVRVGENSAGIRRQVEALDVPGLEREATAARPALSRY